MAANPNLKKVWAMVNGQEVVARYDAELDSYVVETSAPARSSWSQPDHVYLVTLHAEDKAGNVVKMDHTDDEYGKQLEIRVLETTSPIAKIVHPVQSSVIGKNTVQIDLSISDTGESELDMTKVELKINNNKVVEGLAWSGDTNNEKTGIYQATALPDGENTITLTVYDNDGNSATDTVKFIVSTAAPTLDITAPKDNVVTNYKSITVSGIASPGNEYTTIGEVTVNGATVTVEPETGNFTHDVELQEGDNTITIVAKDSADNTTQVVVHVVLDTKAPIITDVSAEKTTVNVGEMIKITFKVTEVGGVNT